MFKFNILLLIIILFSGCNSVLPSVDKKSVSQWEHYKDIELSYNNIVKYKTTRKELHQYGFDPFKTPNIKILNYLDITEKFLVTPSMTLSNLENGLQECIKNKNKCFAYEVTIEHIKKERYGSVFLDLFNFRKKTQLTGWSFYSLIVINHDKVIYKVSRGNPNIKTLEEEKNPLGPFQSMDAILKSRVN